MLGQAEIRLFLQVRRGLCILALLLTAMFGGKGAVALAAAPAAADSSSDTPFLGEVAAEPDTGARATDQLPANQAEEIGPVSVLQVRPDIYMLTVSGENIAVETGADGTIVIDTGNGKDCAALVKAVTSIARGPIRYLVNTSADPERTGCNAALSDAGQAFALGPNGLVATIIAHQNAMLALVAQPGNRPPEAIPSEIFTRPERDSYLNGQPIRVVWMPAAHSSGDTVVVFQRSDVVVAGNVFDITRFPKIDTQQGGSIQGEIDALNRLLNEFTVEPTPRWMGSYGTLVIPSRGFLCSQQNILDYRDMLQIVRGRVQGLIAQGRSLAQVQAADPTAGFSARYGASTGSWTTANFVQAVYKSLTAHRGSQQPQ